MANVPAVRPRLQSDRRERVGALLERPVAGEPSAAPRLHVRAARLYLDAVTAPQPHANEHDYLLRGFDDLLVDHLDRVPVLASWRR